MSSTNKRSGTRWERDAAALLNEEFPNTWKRVPGAGALGTILEMPSLQGDLTGDYYFLTKFVAEAKYGYGGKQMTLRKEWFDKIRKEAEKSYSTPAVVLKFKGARDGVKHVIALDFEAWDSLMTEIKEMHDELLRLYAEREVT